jgi:hypothetical protein
MRKSEDHGIKMRLALATALKSPDSVANLIAGSWCKATNAFSILLPLFFLPSQFQFPPTQRILKALHRFSTYNITINRYIRFAITRVPKRERLGLNLSRRRIAAGTSTAPAMGSHLERVFSSSVMNL